MQKRCECKGNKFFLPKQKELHLPHHLLGDAGVTPAILPRPIKNDETWTEPRQENLMGFFLTLIRGT